MTPGFSVSIPSKPYVKHYLIQNFGNPVNLYQVDNPFLPLLKLLLVRQPTDINPQRRLNPQFYRENTIIMLTDVDFVRLGVDLTRSGIIVFNREVERSFKHMMHVIVAINLTFYGNLETAIDRFTQDLDIPEDIWPHESIRKDFCRHARLHRFDIKTTIFENLTKIFLQQLSEIGTVAGKSIIEYENNAKRDFKRRRNSKSMGYSLVSGRDQKPTPGT